MIVEQSSLHGPTPGTMTGAWRTAIGRSDLTGIRAFAYRLTRSLTEWARVPVLPYAALWEASVIVSLLDQRESFEAHRPAAETSVLTDAWLRG